MCMCHVIQRLIWGISSLYKVPCYYEGLMRDIDPHIKNLIYFIGGRRHSGCRVWALGLLYTLTPIQVSRWGQHEGPFMHPKIVWVTDSWWLCNVGPRLARQYVCIYGSRWILWTTRARQLFQRTTFQYTLLILLCYQMIRIRIGLF